MKKRIVIAETGNIMLLPPLINLMQCLLNNGHHVTLVSRGGDKLPKVVFNDDNFKYIELKRTENGRDPFTKLVSRYGETKEIIRRTKEAMIHADILWTSTVITVRELRSILPNYKNVFQLMELAQYGHITRHIRFSLGELAKKSWKNVVPEENRAYIEKAWWDLSSVPYVLPNKPYSLEYSITDDMRPALKIIESEKRKIVLYLGGIFPDRNLETYAEALKKASNDYVLYIIGRAFDDEGKQRIDNLVKKYGAVHLGHFDAPKHLAFVKYAYIGLLPYKTAHVIGQSELNALYCAPNKIFEYAGFGVPMIGSDVLGLKNIFEKWDIGICADDSSEEDFYKAVKKVTDNHEKMSEQCYKYYDSVNLDKIVNKIICD